MSKIFYDKHINLEEVERAINKHAKTERDRIELWQMVDEIIHHRVIGCVLDKLPEKYHDEFLDNFHKRPHHKSHFKYLKEKIGQDVKDFIKKEIALVAIELLEEVRDSKLILEKKKKTRKSNNG